MFSIVGLVFYLFSMTLHSNMFDFILSICIGFIIILLSKITNNAIGAGDGLIFITIGCFLPFQFSSSVLLYSFILSSLYSLALIVIKKYTHKYKIAFSPFVFLGYLLYMMIYFLER